MKTIKSFELDHDVMDRGLYLTSVSDGIYTYDLRFKKPNGGDYLAVATMHSVEHMFATVIRNSKYQDQVVYFGPMGCRTGFYLLLKNVKYDSAKELITDSLKLCLKLDRVPGNTRKACGNYRSHDILGAKQELTEYLQVLEKI